MNVILETERLLLRKFTIDDVNFIVTLLNSPGWLRFIGDRNIKTQDQAKTYLEKGPFKSYEQNGFGLWMVETRQAQTPIGMCGLIKREYLDVPDIGFAFLPQYNGQGYAFEIASATLLYAKKELSISNLAAITLPENIRSVHLLEKLGFHFSQFLEQPDLKEKLSLYTYQEESNL